MPQSSTHEKRGLLQMRRPWGERSARLNGNSCFDTLLTSDDGILSNDAYHQSHQGARRYDIRLPPNLYLSRRQASVYEQMISEEGK